jgi:hypothetical protein
MRQNRGKKMTDYICPRCHVDLKDWQKFKSHVSQFDHAEAEKRAARDARILSEWATNKYLTPSSMAFSMHIHPKTVYDVLKKKGVNWKHGLNGNNEENKGNESPTGTDIKNLPDNVAGGAQPL